MINNPNDILKEYNYFANQYFCNKECKNDKVANHFLRAIDPRLSDCDSISGEGLINNIECVEIIEDLKNDKFPGNDSLPSEFHKFF